MSFLAVFPQGGSGLAVLIFPCGVTGTGKYFIASWDRFSVHYRNGQHCVNQSTNRTENITFPQVLEVQEEKITTYKITNCNQP